MLVKSGLRLTAPCIAFVSAIATASMLVSGCGDNRQGDGVSVEDGSLNGEIAVYIADDPDNGRSETQYALRAPNGTERTLHFKEDPHLQPGTSMKIWGTEMPEGLRVQTFKTVPKAEPTFIDRITAPLQNGMKYAAKRFAFIVVDVGGGNGGYTEQSAQDELTGPLNTSQPPTRQYYMEASYGTQDLDARAFLLSYPMTACNTSQMATALKPMVNSMGGGTFNHYLWYFGTKVSACGWSGLGEVGTPDKPSDDTWYNASASCVVMVQEPGHNFGMQHSSSMTCPGAPFSDDPDNDCTHNEYGDSYDPMGGGCDHMNAWQKAYNGWLQGCNLVQVKQSGTFTLVPMELACDGVQALQIPAPKSRPFSRAGGGGSATTENLTHYYLEMRTNRGLDTGTAPGLSVLVHVAGKLLGRSQRALHTWILDMDPAASRIQGLTAGKSFTDPAGGVTFTVTELTADKATIDVKMDAQGGGPTCMDGTTPFTAPGPGIESCSAAPVTPGNGGASGSTGGAGGTTPGTGGRPGTGGTPGGTGGRGGSTGTGGGSTGGGPGTGGRGGTGGNATGGANSGGAPSSGGAPGTGGGLVPGTGGAPNSGGAPGSGGNGTGIGTGGAPGSGGDPGITPPQPPDVTGGCACNTAGGSPITGTALAFGAMLLLGAARKRRRK